MILENVMDNVSSDHPLFGDIYKSYLEYSGVKANDDLQKAIKFATGRKEETFCKSVGLVSSELYHNDGTTSKLFLGNGKRSLVKNSYSIMSDGRWNYQLDKGYRDPVKSEVWVNSADEQHYDIQEYRKSSNGKDKGQWTAEWGNDSFSTNFKTKASIKEPIPMHMAMDYQAWGTPDLGYRINFEIGDTQKMSARESTFGHGKIILESIRKVVKKLNKFKMKDLDQKERKYKNCFLVETKIKFAGIENKK